MEKAGKLNRAIEFLPTDEVIATRAQARRGLTRPEMAVLLAYSKIDLYERLLASDLPDDAKMAEDLTRYFPTPLQKAFPQAIASHQLRREIIATVVTNGMVNRVGPTFVSEMVEQTGMGAADVARAYLIVRDAFGLRLLWEGIEALDNKVPAAVQTSMILETNRLMRRAIPWMLLNGAHPLAMTAEVKRLSPCVEALAGAMSQVLSAEAQAALKARAAALKAEGVPADLAKRIAGLPVLAAATDVSLIAHETGRKVEEVASVHFAIGEKLGIDWLRNRAAEVPTENHWQRQALSAIVDDLYGLQGRLAARVLAGQGSTVTELLDGWLTGRSGPMERIHTLLSELGGIAKLDIAMLAVANRQLRGLMAG
jgi:glutamate dehydrogenase